MTAEAVICEISQRRLFGNLSVNQVLAGTNIMKPPSMVVGVGQRISLSGQPGFPNPTISPLQVETRFRLTTRWSAATQFVEIENPTDVPSCRG